MAKETETLVIKWVDWQYKKPTEITPHRQGALVLSGIRLMELRCKNCNHEWKAKEGYDVGCFREVAGEVILDCSSCSTTHRIPRERFG